MDKSRIYALRDTAVNHYRNALIDNYIAHEKWGNCWALQAKTRFQSLYRHFRIFHELELILMHTFQKHY